MLIRYSIEAHPSQCRRVITYSDGSTYLDDTFSESLSQSDYIYHGENIPAWRDKLQRGEDVTTQLTGYRFTAKRAADGYFYAAYNAPSKSYSLATGNMDFTSMLGDDVNPSVVNRARTHAMQQFTKRWHKKTKQWDSGVFAGELLEAARMLASPAKGVRKAVDLLYRDVKNAVKGVPKYSKGYKRAVAGTWLEWNYGVKPLVQDLDNAATAFRALASGRTYDMIRITGVGGSEERLANASGVEDWSQIPELFVSAKRSREVIMRSEVTIRGGWRNDNPSGEMPLPMRFGVGLQQALPTAWELIPWSFFVDYFSNLGDVLDAWSMRFVNFAWLNQTVRNCMEVKYSDIYQKRNAFPGMIVIAKGGHAVLKRYSVSRDRMYNSDWTPSFYLDHPSFVGTDVRKWLNITALAQMKLPP